MAVPQVIHAKFTNHQYHDYDPDTGEYKVHNENSIFFELDGPYKAMILPSSEEEERQAVEEALCCIQRRGMPCGVEGFRGETTRELQLTKIFRSQLFKKYPLAPRSRSVTLPSPR